MLRWVKLMSRGQDSVSGHQAFEPVFVLVGEIV